MRTTQQITALYEQWLGSATADEDVAAELESIRGQEEAIADRFYRDVEFGTGGLRGVLGAGPNRINIYTIGRATLGLCRILLADKPTPSVAIAYDSRIKSDLFAHHAARVLAHHGVQVHLFDRLMPTPALSFAVRALGCDAGIVITASHNPAKYNGYKVYGADGCQITPETADLILAQMDRIDHFELPNLPTTDALLQAGTIKWVQASLITDYLDAVKAAAINKQVPGRETVKIVYTPLNGAGRECVTRVLAETGFTNIALVPEQSLPDGNFPTCPYPNPEIEEALALGLALLRETQGDLLLATDPDCDRVGTAVRQGDRYELISGNEMGVLLFDYICAQRLAQGTMPQRPVCVKTIVTTEMVLPVAAHYGVEVRNVLTGFKFIGEQIGLLEQAGETDRYLFGFEESYGYLSGSFVRDKDGVNASLLICEMAAYYRAQGRTLLDVLDGLYQTYGTYLNHLQSLPFEGMDGFMTMQRLIGELRANPPAELCGAKVVAVSDYQLSIVKTAQGTTPLDLPKSDVLRYDLENEATIVVRPSGTEPKLKVYYSVKAPDKPTGAALIEQLCAYFEQRFR